MLLENIFNSLFKSSNYFNKVYPHLDERYFFDKPHIVAFKKIKEYHLKYNNRPNISDIRLLIETDTNISESDSDDTYEFLKSLKAIDIVSDEKLLIKETESFCQSRALELAILDSVEIIQNKKESKGAIEEKIKKALSVEFDVKIGMDFFKDAPLRYDLYSEEEEIIPTDIEALNTLLNGGFRRKAIHAFLGRTNIGKTAILCHIAACMLRQGRNVVYVTGEMSETMIAKRIDANILDIPVNDLNKNLDRKAYLNKIKTMYDSTHGKLIVKEYPTSSANAVHIKNLLNEIALKKNFTADVIVLDYLNIFASYRLGSGASSNSYNYIKAVTEELRGLAVEHNLALVTATQTNRSGSSKGTDLEMDSISESFGTAMTLDWLCGIIQNEELFQKRRYLFKNLKSRYNSNINQLVTVGIDYEKMRLENIDEVDQEIPKHMIDKLNYEKQKNVENSDNYFSDNFNFD